MKKMAIWLMCFTLIGAAFPAMAQEDSEPASSTTGKVGGVKSLEKRIRQLEEAIGRDVESDKWYDRIQISGLVEVEAAHEKIDVKNPPPGDEMNSTIDLATMELAIDAKITRHVDAHVMFEYGESEVFVDEGFITLVGTEEYPAYLIAGRQYIPFGFFDSFFVTDPTTLILGETNNGAAVAGYRFRREMVDVSAGIFNGWVGKTNSDNTIDGFVVSVVAAPTEGLMLGASYTSNLAASDSLSEFIADLDGDGDPDDNITSLVGGWSMFASYEFLDRFKIIGEYVGADSKFKAGELYDPADTKECQPAAWNLELGVGIIEDLEVAARYGGSKDGGDPVSGEFLLPESSYGAVLNWGIWECNLAFEYLHGEFDKDFQTTDTYTVQLAVEF